MFFEGCAPDLGCSLVLQGGDKTTLAKVKAIMKYLIYVAYHLKLENKFLIDEFALPPPIEKKLSHGYAQEGKARRAVFKIAEEDVEVECQEAETSNSNRVRSESDKVGDKKPKANDCDMLKESKKFSDLLSETLLSSSPFCPYPLPYLLTEEGRKCSCRRFIPDQIYLSDLLNNENVVENLNEGLVVGKEAQENPNLIFKEPHAFTRSSVIPCPQDQTTKCLLADFRARGGLVDLQTYRDFEKLHRERRKEINIKRKGRIEQAIKKDQEVDSSVAIVPKIDLKQNLSREENDKKVR